jgi:protease I
MNKNQNLSGKKVAILLTDGFEESEMVEPRKALIKAGAQTTLIAPKEGKVKSWDTDDFGGKYEVDVVLDEANPMDYDALLLPGGVMNPDKLRTIPAAVDFLRDFFDTGKPSQPSVMDRKC